MVKVSLGVYLEKIADLICKMENEIKNQPRRDYIILIINTDTLGTVEDHLKCGGK